MKRRNFIKIVGTSALALAVPDLLRAEGIELTESEIEAKAKALLSKMTLDEKIKQMSGKVLTNIINFSAGYGKYKPVFTPENKRLGIPGIRFIDGPRGVNFKGSTCFPVAMARGASWDAKLNEKVGEAMGYEARAQGANFFGGVCINVLRHPSWGRSQETYGEDPYHLGVMGVSIISGLQRHLMACAKHFAANSIDKSRHYVDVRMDERTLREIYLPHFKMCVDAGVASIMSAYNNLNGYLCGHNRHLLRDILKDEWGFKGFVISDFGLGVKDTIPAIYAGLDIEMPSTRYYGPKLKRAVQSGKVPIEYIDDAVTRILRQKLRFYHLEKKGDYDKGKIAGSEHTSLAREVAQKSIVLLKNDDNLLPLSRKEIKSIAVFGELADTPNIGDKGSSIVRPPYVITPLKGILNNAGAGIKVRFDSGENLLSARKLAKEADVAIVVVGCTFKDEGEGFDRLNLALPDSQQKLVQAVFEANPKCVVVIEAGGAVTMEGWKDKVPCILMAWYPGMEGGNAISDVLFGDVNPSAKLPIVFPKSKEELFPFDNKAKTVQYDRYHGYRFYDKNNIKPAFAFGFGLSYTKYKYSNLRLDKNKITKNEKLKAKVDVTNKGKVPGDEIVELYIGYPNSKVDRPKKELKAFDKIHLEPSETKTVSLEVLAKDLAYFNENKMSFEIEEIQYDVYVGPSSRDADLLKESFIVSGE